ncbi:MAG: PQQ-binding-like beta-propeller repeat protein, partial [Myxococcota bacterium]
DIDDPTGGVVIDGGGLVVVGGDLSGTVVVTPGTGIPGGPGDIVIETDPGDGSSTTTTIAPAYHATFASSDAFLYGIDLQTGLEVWHAQLRDSAWDAPVVDRDNIIYVGDAQSNLYAFEGKAPAYGAMHWVNTSLGGGPADIVKLGIHSEYGVNGLIVGSGTRAYTFR